MQNIYVTKTKIYMENDIVLHFFISLVNVWFSRRQMILIPSAFSLLQFAHWAKVHEENLASHRSVIEKWKNILIALSDNCGYFSLTLHQNLIAGTFLKFSCSVESETISMNFSYPVALNPLVSFALWMYLLLIHDFITSFIGHLENTGSLSYEDLPNVDKFHYTISKKSHLLTTTRVLSEKSLRC